MSTQDERADTNPAVSVVVPNYNHARFLRARLNSILAQTYRDFELIILDDASTDRSMEVIGEYRNLPGVRIHRNEKNSGSPFPQWNLGATMARGRYLWIAEADDEADPKFLETLVATLDANREVVLAYCQSRRIDARGSSIGNLCDWTEGLDGERWRSAFINAGVDEISRFLIQRCTIPNASAVVFRRDAYLEVGGAPTHLRMVGDWVTYVKILKLGKIAFTAAALNSFRSHAASVRADMGRDENCAEFLDEYLLVFRTISGEFSIPQEVLAKVVRQLVQRWLQCVQNAPVSPSFHWAFQTSRFLGQFEGVGQWSLLDRYLRARAWKTPGIRECLGLVKKGFPSSR